MASRQPGPDEAVPTYGLLIGGEWVRGAETVEARDKYTGEVFAHVGIASGDQVDDAVRAARAAFQQHRLTPYERYAILGRAANLVAERTEAFVQTIIADSGLTYSDATSETNRCIQTLENCAEEAKRIHGEMIPIDSAPGHEHRLGFTIRVPVGVVCAIAPFNAPLNTVAHKIGPALAAGNSVVLKPASYTPVTAVKLCEVLLEAGLPPALLNLVQGGGSSIGMRLLENPDIDFYGFTGSCEVGKVVQREAGLRRTSLELGSISSTIVCEDANLDWATPRCVNASYRKAGQVCTSVQRLYVHADIVDEVVSRLAERLAGAKVGDPYDPKTLVGPMIDVREAERVESWIREAAAGGARIVTGGERDGAVLSPTVLLDVDTRMKVMCEEVFGPVISVLPYTDFDAAIESANSTPFGLTAGIFTNDINRALKASRELHVGTVHINETSSAKADLMPSGGAKDSGIGREGPKYAIEEMTEERLVTVSLF